MSNAVTADDLEMRETAEHYRLVTESEAIRREEIAWKAGADDRTAAIVRLMRRNAQDYTQRGHLERARTMHLAANELERIFR